MKVFLFFVMLIPLICFSQTYADKSFYLINNLVLEDLSNYDRNLIDSCLTDYHRETEDTIKINIISNLVEECWDDNVWPQYNLWVHNYTKDKTNNIAYKKCYAGSLNNIGYFYGARGDVDKALEYYNKSLKILEEIDDGEGIATAFNNIGSIYDDQGQIKKALKYYHLSLIIQEKIDDKEGAAASLNNIGSVYDDQGQIKKALEYHHKSLKLYTEINNKKGIATSLNNIGLIYNTQGLVKKALNYYNRSLKIIVEIGDKDGISASLNNIGLIYNTLGQKNVALDYYYRSLSTAEEINDNVAIANSSGNIGMVYLFQNKIEKAKKLFERAFAINVKLGYPEKISRSSSYLSKIAIEQKNYKVAYEMYKLHISMRDSVNNIETQKASIQQQLGYKYETQKTLDDAENDKLIAIEKEQQEKQRLITYGVACGLGLVALFLAFVFNRLHITKKQKVEIELQKQIVEQQKRQVELTHQEITDSINYAKRLQNAILPAFSEVDSYIKNNFIFFQPKDVVSGDFYWFENKVVNGKSISLIASADCTGHGVPGALVSVVCSNALNRTVNEFGIIDPSKILDKTRELVIETFTKSSDDVKDGMDIALCVFTENKVIFSGANNPLWVVRDSTKITKEQELEKATVIIDDKALIEYKSNRQPIGLYKNMKPFTQTEIVLLKNDMLYFFTDGFADQFGGVNGKKFKYKPFKKLLIELSSLTMKDQKDRITSEFNNWKNDLEQVDDVCIIGVKAEIT